MYKKEYPKSKGECVTCKVEFDNWLSNQEYDLEQEERARKSFCNYCPFCKECGKEDCKCD
jgi:hypothetical protein